MISSPNKGGRPRGFDRNEAVETAMRLFWRHGYEGVSLAMLTEAIGVAPPSIYAAFGSKEELYRETLERYISLFELMPLQRDDEEHALDEALARLFDRAIAGVTGERGERGCMISTGLLACHPSNGELEAELAANRRSMAERLDRELQRWLAYPRSGEVARFICAVIQGIAIQAKDGSNEFELRLIADQARSCIKNNAHGNSRCSTF